MTDLDNGLKHSKEAEMDNLVNQLRERLEGHQFDVTPKMDYEFLAKFIRARKYDVESAAIAFKKYYAHKFRHLKRVQGIKPSDYIPAYDSRTFVILKNKVNGSKVLLFSCSKWDPSVFSYRNAQDAILLLYEELLHEVEVQPYGNIFIFDMGGFGFRHLKQCLPSDVKYTVTMGVEGLPSRVTGIHIINAPRAYWPLHQLFIKFLPEKIRNRLHLHTKLESLHNIIGRDCLPNTLGGNLGIEEAMDTELLNQLLKKDCPCEDYWSGEALN